MKATNESSDEYDDEYDICPYCGNEQHVEEEDYSEEMRETECSECNKKYRIHQSFSVTHHTTPDCELNGEEHDFSRCVMSCKVCVKCDKYVLLRIE